MKNMPLIFDQLVNEPPLEPDMPRIRPLLFQAKHFVLDPQACAFVSKLSNDKALMDELREFALPPFDKLALTHIYGAGHEGYPAAAFDGQKQGYQSLTLWDRGEWKFWVARHDGSQLAAIPGWCVNQPDGLVTNARAVELEAKKPGSSMEDVARILGSLAAHRTIIDAFFLLMLQPKHYQVNFNDPRRSLHRGKTVRFFARSEIKIDLTDVATFRRGFYSGARGAPRWHEVRAHFVHFGGDRSHVHVWDPIASDDGKHRWGCACGRRRVERRYPEGRGDAAKGFVRQSYSITASRS